MSIWRKFKQQVNFDNCVKLTSHKSQLYMLFKFQMKQFLLKSLKSIENNSTKNLHFHISTSLPITTAVTTKPRTQLHRRRLCTRQQQQKKTIYAKTYAAHREKKTIWAPQNGQHNSAQHILQRKAEHRNELCACLYACCTCLCVLAANLNLNSL